MADAWHHRSDVLTSTAAFIGIAIALWGGPGWESADDWAALVAAVIIGANGIRLLRPAVLARPLIFGRIDRRMKERADAVSSEYPLAFYVRVRRGF